MANPVYWFAVTVKTGGTCKCVNKLREDRMTPFLVGQTPAQFNTLDACKDFLGQQTCVQGGRRFLVRRRVGCACFKKVDHMSNLVKEYTTEDECVAKKVTDCT